MGVAATLPELSEWTLKKPLNVTDNRYSLVSKEIF